MLKRTSLALGTLIRMRPRVQNQVGITCAICQRAVDFESLVEGEPGKTTYAKILYRCHGAEDMQILDMGSTEWDPEMLASMIRRLVVFRPDQGERPHSAGGLDVRLSRDDATQSHPLVKLASERFSETVNATEVLKRACPQRPISHERAQAFGDAVERLKAECREEVKLASERHAEEKAK